MKLWKYLFGILFLILALIVIALFQLPDSNLHIISCNVGQGDATLITYKNIQVLTDGGPDSKVLDCLGQYIPFYDREIELVVLTHPQKDHYMGLINVFRRYKVGSFLYNDLALSTPEYQLLEKEVGRGSVKRYEPGNIRRLRLSLIYLDILSPDGEIPNVKFQISNEKQLPEGEVNHLSIVSLVSFGNFKGLLMGDAPPEISDRLAAESVVERVNYIKIPHHGSNSGLTENLLKVLRPNIAAISVGKNSYGHPTQQILDMLKKYGVETFRTDQNGDIEIVTDGKRYWMKN